jgi:hypothetical protein
MWGITFWATLVLLLLYSVTVGNFVKITSSRNWHVVVNVQFASAVRRNSLLQNMCTGIVKLVSKCAAEDKLRFLSKCYWLINTHHEEFLCFLYTACWKMLRDVQAKPSAGFISKLSVGFRITLIMLTWKIGWAPNNASKWQMGFNSVLKGLSLALNHALAFPVRNCFWSYKRTPYAEDKTHICRR